MYMHKLENRKRAKISSRLTKTLTIIHVINKIQQEWQITGNNTRNDKSWH